VFRSYIEQRGGNEAIEIDSAGTIGFHTGKPADARMRAAAAKRGFDLTSRSRKVTAADLTRFDLVVAMDRANYDDLLELAPAAGERVCLLGSFLPGGFSADPKGDAYSTEASGSGNDSGSDFRADSGADSGVDSGVDFRGNSGGGVSLGPDVPDPYYGGAEGFEQVLDMIASACPAILERLLEGPTPS